MYVFLLLNNILQLQTFINYNIIFLRVIVLRVIVLRVIVLHVIYYLVNYLHDN
jgi:hypothetical protein